MDCSPDVFESSGIEIIGDVLPDLSPIKANSRGRQFPDGTLCRMHCMSLKLAKKNYGVWVPQQTFRIIYVRVLDNIFSAKVIRVCVDAKTVLFISLSFHIGVFNLGISWFYA